MFTQTEKLGELDIWYNPLVSLTVNTRAHRRLADDLLTFQRSTAREVSSAALNRTAKGASLFAKQNLQAKFTLRNKFTLGSIRHTRTPPSRPIDRQFVLVGSIQPYLAKQEKGGSLSRTKTGRRLTTSEGSREGASAFPRRKLARGRYRSSNIRLGRRGGGRTGSVGRQAKRAVESARAKKKKFVYLNLGNDRAGIFRVERKRIKMVHRIMGRPVSVKARPWLKPATDKARRLAPKVFRQELGQRLRRSNLFKS